MASGFFLYLKPIHDHPKKDGSIDLNVRVSPELDKRVNAGFRGKWLNAENIGKSEAEMVVIWNAAHPEDPIPTDE